MHDFDDKVVTDWLSKKANTAINYPNNARLVVDWLLNGDYRNPQDLCRQLWRPISMPTHIANCA